jgi:hypothetical protein
MRRVFAFSIVMVFLGAATGCGSDASDQEEVRTNAERQQALRDSAFGDMTESLDRAREVEQLQEDRKKALDAALEASGGQ